MPLTLADLVPDPDNANVHTPRTIGSIVDSIHAAGVGRGVVIDENNVILAGNGTVEAAMEAGLTKLIVIDQDKAALTVVKRTGLSAEQKVRLALDDNRSAEFSAFDCEALKQVKQDGIDVSALWSPVEWDMATTPTQPFTPAPTVNQKSHGERVPELRLGSTRIPLTDDMSAALDARFQAWIQEFSGTGGIGTALADAFIAAVEDDDACKAL